VLQILNGGAPCQQVDSEEEDEQEAEAEDEVSGLSLALSGVCCCLL